MKQIYHENLNFDPVGLPVKVLEMNKNANELGCDFHWHEAIEIYYVIKGSLNLNINGTESRIQVGDIGFVNPMGLHRGSAFEEGTKHYIIQINLSYLKKLYLPQDLFSPDLVNTNFIRNDHELNGLLASIIQAFQSGQSYYKLNIIGLTYTLLSVFLQKYHEDTPKQTIQTGTVCLHQVQAILSYISEHYREKITLDLLAKELGISKAYMCRIFKRHTHQTIIHHINEQKCHYAASLMLDGHHLTDNGHHLTDTAFACGFDDYNYFSRVFKKIMGVSPLNYSSRYI